MKLDHLLRYCAALELHNDRAWFHDPDNHKRYMEARQDFTDLVEALKFRVADLVSPDLAQRLIFAEPKSLLYRIPRDMRTNKGKPPYNPRWAADISAGRHSYLPLGYYVHLQPGDRSMFGTGVWPWDKDVLPRVRMYLSENFDRFADALARCGCPMQGDRLKTMPRGFDPGDPAAEYLKFKDWFVAQPFADRELTDSDRFLDAAAATVERMEPLRRFFNDALTGRRKNPFDIHDWD